MTETQGREDTEAVVAAILLAGFGKVDITPPVRIPYLSYYPRQTPLDRC